MRLLKLIPDTPSIDFMRWRRLAFGVAGGLVCLSLALFATRGLNLGIDFLGGILVEARTEGPADLSDLRGRLGSADLGDVSIQEFGAPDTVLIRIQRQDGDDGAQQTAVETVKGLLDGAVAEYRRTELVGPTVGAELRQAAFWAVMAALAAILIYIWFRFEWQFGVAAIIALTHDVITTVGLFSLLQLDFNLATVAALLTIAGYSINDTVVVFDSVRENLRRYKRKPLAAVYNLAVNQTLSRTVVTGVTTLLAVMSLAVFGGEVIRTFAIAIAWGVVIGTFSSVALAAPLLLYMRPPRGGDDDGDAPAA